MELFATLPHPHVISLEHKTGRRQRFYERAASHGFPGIEWFPAVRGAAISDLPSWATGCAGAYGCMHSHVELYKKALAGGWPALTVFEDDAEICRPHADFLAELNQRNDDTDHFCLYPPTGWCIGTFGYVIFPRFMERLVALLESQRFPEGRFCHIDQVIDRMLSGHGWVRGSARIDLVRHGARTDSDVQWHHALDGPKSGNVNLASAFEKGIPAAASHAPAILVAISSRGSQRSERDGIRTTWLRDLPPHMRHKFFVGMQPATPDEHDIMIMDLPDDGPHEEQRFLRFAARALWDEPFDYIFRCSDETYLAPGRLAEMVSPAISFLGNEALITKAGLACPHAGYLISRRRLEAAVADGGEIAEDGKLPVDFFKSEPGWGISGRLGGDFSSPTNPIGTMISFKRCSPNLMKGIHEILHGMAKGVIRAVHQDWTDDLIFYSSGLFLRCAAKWMGTWSIRDGLVVLDWYDWPSEILGSLEEDEDLRILLDEDSDWRDPRRETTSPPGPET